MLFWYCSDFPYSIFPLRNIFFFLFHSAYYFVTLYAIINHQLYCVGNFRIVLDLHRYMNELKVSLSVQCVCVGLMLILCFVGHVPFFRDGLWILRTARKYLSCPEAVASSSLVPLLGIPLSGRGCCLATGIQTLFHFSLIFFHWLSARAET